MAQTSSTLDSFCGSGAPSFHSALSDTRSVPLISDEPLKIAIPVSGRERRARLLLLIGSYIILFMRYTIATFLSSFFPLKPPGVYMSETFNGLIFAAYPLGMALTSVFAPYAIMRIGTRVSVIVGLCATVVFTVAFGVAPDFVPDWEAHAAERKYDWIPSMEALFVATYFLNGLLGSFAESACLILVSAKFANSSGAVMASVNTVCTLGCMLGPVVGSILYSIPDDKATAFRLPFFVCGAIPLALLPFVPSFIPQEYISGNEGGPPPTGLAAQDEFASAHASGSSGQSEIAPPSGSASGPHSGSAHSTAALSAAAAPFADVPSSVNSLPEPHEAARAAPDTDVVTHLPLTASVGFGLASIALSGTIVGTLDPTLGIRLNAAPFHFQPDAVSLFFFYSSVVYVLTATPIGRLVDKMPPSSRMYKLITASGFFFLFLTFGLLAPIGPSAFGPKGQHDTLQDSLNNLPCTAIAIGIKGIGSALSNVAIYPDLVLNLPDNPVLQATLTAWWNAAYAIGWAAGPILGGVLYNAFELINLCLDECAGPPNCPEQLAHGSHPTSFAFPDVHALRARPRANEYSASSVVSSTMASSGPHTNDTADCASCSCYWQPGNGFDGFATSTAIVALVYTLCLAVAVVFNLRNPEPKLTLRPLRSA